MLAYDYPLLAMIVTILVFFLWIAWLWLLFKVVMDIFRSDDLGGGGKALWTIFVVLMPYLGVFVYLLVRGHGMSRRDIADAQAADAQFQAYVRQAAAPGGSSGGAGGVADELHRLADLKDRGVITDAELQAQKERLL